MNSVRARRLGIVPTSVMPKGVEHPRFLIQRREWPVPTSVMPKGVEHFALAVDAELAPDRADLPLFRRGRHAKRIRLARPPGRVVPDAGAVIGASLRFQEPSRRSDEDPVVG